MHIRMISMAMTVLLAACSPDSSEKMTDAPAKTTVNTPEQTTPVPEATQTRFTYPAAKQSDQTDTYHGIEIADPYRWMENIDSEEVKTWIEAENAISFDYLKNIEGHAAIEERLTQLWNYERYTVPFKSGDSYFFRKNNGLQNQYVLYSQKTLEDEAKILLDPNTLSEDGTVALSSYEISPDGKYLAYGLATAGSDWNDWFIRDTQSGEDLSDELNWVKFSGVSWTADSQGFFYSRYDEPTGENKLKAVNYYQKLWYHKLGTPQEQDVLIYERTDEKEWGFAGEVTEDGRYLIISVWRGTEQKNLVFYKDLSQENSAVVELIPEWLAEFSLVGNLGSKFFFKTDYQAPHSKVIEIDSQNPAQDHWKTVVAETEQTLDSVSYINHQFIVTSMKDAHHQVAIHDPSGQSTVLELPGLGSVSGFYGKSDQTETFYSFTSFNSPSRIFRLDLNTQESTLFKTPQLEFDPQQYTTEQIFYQSKDGTKVPMFISYKKGLTKDGNNPTLLYGYGGFNISLTPSFSVANLVWMEMGGIFAMPNLRGGGEYGQAWHQAGTKTQKQNVFDDFIAAGEWLIANQYTQKSKLANYGGSNGGLLAAATALQRPDLFAASIPAVGVLDMLRFNQFTIGWAWESDYGSPDNLDEFNALLAYSPLHNLKPGTAYPATLITTADHDDRVFPAHSFKFAAALQAAHKGDNPVLIRIESKAGHGAGKPTSKRIEEAADRIAFLKQTLKL